MTTDITVTKLVNDLKLVIDDGEQLLRATASQAGEAAAAARNRMLESIASAKAKVGEAERVAAAKARDLARAPDAYVQAHPWTMIGAAAGIGLLVGVLLGRR